MKKSKIISVFYHSISDNELPHIKYLYKIKSKKDFIKDLDFLLKKYKPIDFWQLKKHINKEQIITKKSFFLSFDDGLRECYHTIAPILKQKGVPATFFLNSDFIDNKDLFFRYKASLIIDKIFDKNKINIQLLNKVDPFSVEKIKKIKYSERNNLDKIAQNIDLNFNDYLIKQKPYLSSQEIRSLISDGFAIGSHSIDHPKYQHLDIQEQVRQTKNSSDFICKKFNLDYKIFAFPFTDNKVSKEFFNIIFNNKFAEITFGTAGLKHDSISKNIQRIAMEKNGKTAQQIIKQQNLYYFIKSFFGKNMIIR